MSDELIKLLQTVQHRLAQQLASSGHSFDTTFTRESPQLLDAGAQPGQVTTDLLKEERRGEAQGSNGATECNGGSLLQSSSVSPQMAADTPAAC